MFAALVFIATYAVVAIGRLPGARLDRAGAALIGASLMVASGTLSLDEAYRAVDLGTITLLLGMMIVVANLRFAGFFGLAARAIAQHARHPVILLLGVVAVSGGLSAFLVNDTVCLMLTPVVAEAALALARNPLPYLLAVAMASNIGSAATITGNPQNMMIGSLSRIPYGSFAAALAPVAALGLGVAALLLVVSFPAEFLDPGAPDADPAPGARQPRAAGERRWPPQRRWWCFSFSVSRPPRSRSLPARCCCLPGDQAGARLCRDRLVAAADVRGPVHRRRRRPRRRC